MIHPVPRWFISFHIFNFGSTSGWISSELESIAAQSYCAAPWRCPFVCKATSNFPCLNEESILKVSKGDLQRHPNTDIWRTASSPLTRSGTIALPRQWLRQCPSIWIRRFAASLSIAAHCLPFQVPHGEHDMRIYARDVHSHGPKRNWVTYFGTKGKQVMSKLGPEFWENVLNTCEVFIIWKMVMEPSGPTASCRTLSC